MLEPVLFAFTIEFVLIGDPGVLHSSPPDPPLHPGATVFGSMWASIGSPHQGPQRVLAVPHIRKTLDKLDWSNSLWGFLLGLLVLLLNVASLVIFFTISSSEHSMDEYAG